MSENNVSRFERQTVTFAPRLEVDGYQTPNGEFRVGMAGVSTVVGFASNWLSRLKQRNQLAFNILLEKGFTGEVLMGSVVNERGASIVKTISLEDFKILLNYAASEGNPKALTLLGLNRNKRIVSTPESVIRDKLAAKLKNATTEVICNAGKIDILTDTEIIEVKNVNKWKSAIGQVLVYGLYYPSKTKRIHLFGKITDSAKKMVLLDANKLGVCVTFD